MIISSPPFSNNYFVEEKHSAGCFFHVFFSKRIHDKFHFAFMSAVSGTCFQLEKAYGEQDFSQSSGNRKNSPMNS